MSERKEGRGTLAARGELVFTESHMKARKRLILRNRKFFDPKDLLLELDDDEFVKKTIERIG